jgi:hypothetical protein
MRRHLSSALIAIILLSTNPFIRDYRGADPGDRSFIKVVRHILHKLVPGGTGDELVPPKP